MSSVHSLDERSRHIINDCSIYFSANLPEILLTLIKCWMACFSLPCTRAKPKCLTWWQDRHNATILINFWICLVSLYSHTSWQCSGCCRLDWQISQILYAWARTCFDIIFHCEAEIADLTFEKKQVAGTNSISNGSLVKFTHLVN